jgi:hypothetical protein
MSKSKRSTTSGPQRGAAWPPGSAGLTLDSGALIALEDCSSRIGAIIEATRLARRQVTVPIAAMAEWWRDTPAQRYVRTLFTVEAMNDERLAKRAGVALGRLRKPGEERSNKRRVSAVDAIVMASAATRGDIVYTSDREHLGRLIASFDNVEVLSVNGPSA